MRDSFLLLFGVAIVAVAIALGVALARGGSHHRNASRLGLAGCVAVAAAGLEIAVVYGIGTSPTDGSGITVELGLAMMALAVVWFIFRHEVLDVCTECQNSSALLLETGAARVRGRCGCSVRSGGRGVG